MDLNALDGNILPAARPHKTSQGSNPPDTSGLCLLDAAPGSTLTTYNATTFVVPFSSERGFGVQTATEDSSILATGQPLHNGRTNNDPTSASSWHADTQHQFGRNGFLSDQPPDGIRFGSMWQPSNPSAAGPEDTTASPVQERLPGRHASQMWPAARPRGAFADMATESNVIIPAQRLERLDGAAPAATMYTSPVAPSLRPSPFHPSSSGTQEDEARSQRPLFAFAPGQMWPTEPRHAVNWPAASSSWPPPHCVHTATQAAAEEELLDYARPCSPPVGHQNNSDNWASLRLHNDAALRADSDWQAERALHDVQPLPLPENVWDHYRISTEAGTSRQPTNQTWPYFQPASCRRPSNIVVSNSPCSHGQRLPYPVAPRQPETNNNNNNAHNSGWHLQQYEHDHAACLVHRLTWYENALATLPLLLENNAVACPSSLLSLPRPLQPSQLTPPTQPQFRRPSAGRVKTFQPMQMVFRERNRWTTSSGSGNSSSHYNIGTGIGTGRNGISGTPDPSPPPLPLGLPSASSYSTTSGGGNVLGPQPPLPPPLSPAEQQFRRRQGISLNYRGDVHNPHNRGDHVPAHCNTALFLTGLPPTPARGLPHAAAKVAFFTRAQAERLYARIAAGQLVFDGSPAAVTCTWNRDKKPPRRCVQADECRVLRIRGPRAFVNYAALTAYFAQKFRYDLESVQVLPPGPTGDKVTTKDHGEHGEHDEHDERDEQTMEWRFASFQSQAIAAKMALNQEHRAVRVTYGRDPLEWGEL
ncbi:hypothetical protein SPI_07147 [Niveomyces insectorum RCEF 264]|uniref:Uncharacterized protein n=1 Tax=Niveomyces insectorum RCEF 264 TaxID=1081102 RepID=A0A167QBR4_9HYPO|nr:hypothetical protein SPI_07147 [Niveomyces insectorum RCEF 264]